MDFKITVDLLNKRRFLIGPNFEQGKMLKKVEDKVMARWYYLFELGFLFGMLKVALFMKEFEETEIN